MSVGTWDPKRAKTSKSSIETDILQEFIKLSQTDKLEELADAVDQQTQSQQLYLMSLEQADWIAVAETLSNEEIHHLIRFFTVAEMALPGWDAGAKSPVIGLVKTLKKRGVAPSKEFVYWIKSHTNNRFLPHGPL